MNKAIKTILFVALAALPVLSSAQRYYDDVQIRASIFLEKKLGKKFSVHLNQQNRWSNNAMEFNRAYADIGVTFKLHKKIRLMADYVLIQRKKDNGLFTTRHWYYVAAILRHDMGRWRFSYRNMFQARFNNMNSEHGQLPRYYNRNKLMVKYDITKRLGAFVGGEIFIPLNNPQLKGIERTRSLVGMEINTFKNQQLELYFMYQVRLQQGDWYKQRTYYPYAIPRRDFIYGISYSFSF